jgi:hypothetical protein
MPAGYAEARNIVFLKSAVFGRSLFTERKEHMSRTIKAIERHRTLPTRTQTAQPSSPKLIAEWQQRGPETLSGLALRKLRLTFAPPQFVTTASAAG